MAKQKSRTGWRVAARMGLRAISVAGHSGLSSGDAATYFARSAKGAPLLAWRYSKANAKDINDMPSSNTITIIQ